MIEYEYVHLYRRLDLLGDWMPSCRYLVDSYEAPDRHYHSLHHIADCLEKLTEVRDQLVEPDLVEMALWWHDVIYDTRRGDNEMQSAIVADDWLSDAGMSREDIVKIREMILSTKTHTNAPVPDGKYLIDIDLSILGANPGSFDMYEAGIRAEYGWVDDGTYERARREFLLGMSRRERIFTTEHFYTRYQSKAIANIARSLKNPTAL